jgi:hypothetical protein
LDHRGQTGRKEATIKQATSAMESLAQYLEKETTPQDIVVVDDTLKDTYATLPNEETELNDEEITNIVTMLKKYKESNTTAYAMLLEQLKTDNLALFEKIQPLLD